MPVTVQEEEKNRKLNDLLDALDFNQVRAPAPRVYICVCISHICVCTCTPATRITAGPPHTARQPEVMCHPPTAASGLSCNCGQPASQR